MKITNITAFLALTSASLFAGGKAEIKFTDGGSHGTKTRIEKNVTPQGNPQDKKNKDEKLLFDSAAFSRDKNKKLTFFLDKWGVCHYRIPQITKDSSGRLIALINGRINQDGDHGYSTTFFATSENEGKTWDYIRPSTDYTNKKRLAKKKGQFPLFKGTQDTTLCQIPGKKEFLALVHEKSSGILWATRSKDLLTWGKPYEVMPKVKGNRYIVAGPASATLDVDGKTIIFTIHGRFGGKGKEVSNYFAWTKDGIKFNFSSEAVVGSTESSAVGLGKGRYLIQSRPKKGPRVISIYNKKTDTWENGTFPLKSHPGVEASLWRDKDGTIFFCTPTKGRSAGFLYKTKDEGKSWKPVMALSKSGAFGYSSIIRLNKKQMAVLSERNRIKNGGSPKEYLNDIIFKVIDVPQGR